MTRVCVDDQVAELNLSEQNELEEVVQSMVSKMAPNRIVREVTLDGKHVSLHDRRGNLQHTVSEVRELQIRTADRAMWAANGLDIALSQAERLRSGVIRMAEICYEIKPASERLLGQWIEGLEQFYESIICSQVALGLNFNRIEVEGLSLSRLERELDHTLNVITSCQEKRDFPAIAELLEYTLITNLSLWTRALRQIGLAGQSNA